MGAAPASPFDVVSIGDDKRAAAEHGAALVEDGMRVGLGTGTTVAFLLPALAARGLDIVCVATSADTDRVARELGLDVRAFDELDRLDIALDGADQVAPSGWVVKGGGGAHTREKIVAAGADRFVVLVSPEKLVDEVHAPIPLELLSFGLPATLRALEDARVRGVPASPDGGVIADYLGGVGDPRALADRLSQTPGVVDHGLFPPELVSEVIVGESSGVRTIRF